MAAADVARDWGVPGLAVGTIGILVLLASTEVIGTAVALAGTIVATLVLILYIGERPLITETRPASQRLLGAAVALVWFIACYVPFHTCLFPGAALVTGAQVTAAGSGLPLRIPAGGHAAIDLVMEGRLTPNPTGDVAPPVHYSLTLEGGGGTQVVKGVFEDRLSTRRLGRRGTATVHQAHTSERRVVPNPGRGEMSVTHIVLEPESAQPITVSAYAHPLPGPLVLGLLAAALMGAVIAFDRLGPAPATDGALTLSTAAVLGTAVIFWTSNAVRPDFLTLVGSVIFGGPLGFIAGGVLWWMAKRLIADPGR